jgi:Holin of 3TMs, for gene-transfer release
MIPLPLIAPIIDIAGKLFDRLIPDKAAAEKAKSEFAAVAQGQEFQIALAQIAVNAEEAKSASIFVAGWRPFVGWVCGIAFAYVAVFEPIARFIAVVAFGYKSPFPVIDTMLTLQVLGGLLGLGAFRTYEKKQGVARGSVGGSA